MLMKTEALSATEVVEMVQSARANRKARRWSQHRFWSQIGVSQTSGSRIEKGGVVLRHVALLYLLRESGAVSIRAIEEASACAHLILGQNLQEWENRPNRSLLSRSRKWIGQLARERRSRNESQDDFWSPIAVTQSAGSRFESGQPVSEPVMILLILRLNEDVDDATLGEFLTAMDAGGLKGKSRGANT